MKEKGWASPPTRITSVMDEHQNPRPSEAWHWAPSRVRYGCVARATRPLLEKCGAFFSLWLPVLGRCLHLKCSCGFKLVLSDERTCADSIQKF